MFHCLTEHYSCLTSTCLPLSYLSSVCLILTCLPSLLRPAPDRKPPVLLSPAFRVLLSLYVPILSIPPRRTPLVTTPAYEPRLRLLRAPHLRLPHQGIAAMPSRFTIDDPAVETSQHSQVFSCVPLTSLQSPGPCVPGSLSPFLPRCDSQFIN